ncbi:polysaccharide pyruvyl transferase family protein [Riemerella columbina]|uniref:polysaccharide pyruvyl transferase family protein n=1 Tax=Riemerella columbina TaxID=103810 RepID=UPI00266FE9DD|nr:polysaccharide pyruvyl transferase family protein [Riemerella columbina]WKS95139.1 polysaccharide pyruvyl transferase family protein [Riemerella columbina]
MINSDKIIKLKRILEESLTPLISQDFALIDIPDHDNIGDNLIWEGELYFLKNIPYKKYYECSLKFFSADKIRTNTTLLMHGGGNFGDIYPVVNEFRIRLIHQFKNNKIIILPQTLHYQSEDILLRDAQIINQHPDITICCRDKKSYDLALKYFHKATILLLPDMAFCIDLDRFSTSNKGSKTLIMNRKDNENIKLSIQLEQPYDILDWPTFNTSVEKRHKKLRFEHRLDRIAIFLKKMPLFSFFIDDRYGIKDNHRKEKFIDMGIEFFSSYETIYTTRLHGMILAVLMGKHVVILDNNYGKLSSFYEEWLKDFKNISLYNK